MNSINLPKYFTSFEVDAINEQLQEFGLSISVNKTTGFLDEDFIDFYIYEIDGRKAKRIASIDNLKDFELTLSNLINTDINLKDECNKLGYSVEQVSQVLELSSNTMRDWCKSRKRLMRTLFNGLPRFDERYQNK